MNNRPYYSISPANYGRILVSIIEDAIRRSPSYAVISDVMMWTQKWPNIDCGFNNNETMKVETLSPTVVVELNHSTKYVYHDANFAYELKGQNTVEYYDAIRARRLPGAIDPKRFNLCVTE